MISNISQDFGNDWGLYIDIENLNNHEEELKDKYTTQKFKQSKYYDYTLDYYYGNIYKDYDYNDYNDYNESIYDEYQYYQKEKNKNDEYQNEKNKKSVKYFTRLGSSIFITAAITIIVIFVI